MKKLRILNIFFINKYATILYYLFSYLLIVNNFNRKIYYNNIAKYSFVKILCFNSYDTSDLVNT